MIPLAPLPECDARCIYDGSKLSVCGGRIPGARCLAKLSCPVCHRIYYADLPVGQALASPMVIEEQTGRVFDPSGHLCQDNWFADWLKKDFQNRSNEPLPLKIHSQRTVRQPLLLNCLNAIYGHSLLALLNAQYYIDCCPDWDLIVLVPEQLKWMVPDGVAEIWSIPWSFSNGWVWNDRLADTIHQRLSSFENCALSVAIPHPHSREWNIERFTGFKPFATSHESILPDDPVVTFIWRDDRFWAPNTPQNRGRRILKKISQRFHVVKNLARIQQDRFIEVAKALRQDYPDINLAVAGLGERHSSLPVWIRDERSLQVSESIERSWCERYARSHLVIGMHGSNMLLPSAHAGAVLDLVPTDRWGNFYQDILLHETDSRTLAHRCRFLPDETSPKTVAEVARTMLTLPKWLKLCEARRRVTAAGSFHRPHQSGLKEKQCAALPE